MAKQKMSTKKKASAVVAGVLAVALAVGGAYAWTNFDQHAVNYSAGVASPQVLLHDDFDGTNKDVYVENNGDSAVYVRVKFAEYLQIGNNSMLTAYSADGTGTDKADPDDITTWPVHQFLDAGGDRDSGNAKSAHNYFEWVMTGNERYYLAGVTESDGRGYGGLSEDKFNNLPVNVDVPIGDITTQKKMTLPTEGIMTLNAWLALDPADRPQNACWLLDTDGWAYWSDALQPGTATNLLLDEVQRKEVSPYDNWEYNIDVQLQAVTPGDLDAWFRDNPAGNMNVPVADPDNSVFTVTQNGYDLLVFWNGGPISTADGIFMGADGNSYESVGNNIYRQVDPTTLQPTTGELILAGQDRMPGNAPGADNDDNMLAGRSLNNNGSSKQGGIAVTAIDSDALTYKIDGGDTSKTANIIVYAGIDNELGTYDDVITSVDGTTVLGTYEIDGDNDNDDLVGWYYLGGTIDNMLVTTEYVFDNVKFNSSTTLDSNSDSKVDAYVYQNSVLDTKIRDIGAAMSVAYVKSGTTTVDMSAAQHTGNYVYTCIAKQTDSSHQHGNKGNGYCLDANYAYSTYWTEPEVETQSSFAADFFALSLTEVLEAYGDSTDADVRKLRIAQAAQGTNTTGNGLNSTTWKDADGNAITTTHYWLRSPGYEASRAAHVNASGYARSNTLVTYATLGARPACYLNLAS